jgi:hypothetical protein
VSITWRNISKLAQQAAELPDYCLTSAKQKMRYQVQHTYTYEHYKVYMMTGGGNEKAKKKKKLWLPVTPVPRPRHLSRIVKYGVDPAHLKLRQLPRVAAAAT